MSLHLKRIITGLSLTGHCRNVEYVFDLQCRYLHIQHESPKKIFYCLINQYSDVA